MDIRKKFSTEKNVFIDRKCLYFALLFLLAVIGNAGLSRTALGKFFKSYLCFENDVLFSNANDTGILGKKNSEFSQQELNLRPSDY